jgi:hypothetical protein
VVTVVVMAGVMMAAAVVEMTMAVDERRKEGRKGRNVVAG